MTVRNKGNIAWKQASEDRHKAQTQCLPCVPKDQNQKFKESFASTESKKNRQTDRQADGQAGRQTNIENIEKITQKLIYKILNKMPKMEKGKEMSTYYPKYTKPASSRIWRGRKTLQNS